MKLVFATNIINIYLITSANPEWFYLYDYAPYIKDSNLPDGSEDELAICDKFGNFLCEGKYNNDNGCSYNKSISTCDKDDADLFNSLGHKINPYESAEARIMFSTWNLDHV